jgi:hypothetical protein
MRTAIICAFVAAATTLVAAPQQPAYRPGEMTKAEVWIRNRGNGEAIPVDLREANIQAPLKVQVMNGESFTPQPVQVRLTRQSWEYKSVTVSTRDDPAVALRAEGEGGWETTGIMFANGDRATLLLKRLR